MQSNLIAVRLWYSRFGVSRIPPFFRSRTVLFFAVLYKIIAAVATAKRDDIFATRTMVDFVHAHFKFEIKKETFVSHVVESALGKLNSCVFSLKSKITFATGHEATVQCTACACVYYEYYAKIQLDNIKAKTKSEYNWVRAEFTSRSYSDTA